MSGAGLADEPASSSTLARRELVLVEGAILHDQAQILLGLSQQRDVLQWIAVADDEVRGSSRRDVAR